jgi:Fe2+ or Zn2+ uptake regulation protein
MSTYAIAGELDRSGLRKAHPNSVHRTLHALAEAGLVIPIASWKKYLISPDPGRAAWVVSLCDRCRAVVCTPATNLVERLQSICGPREFAIRTIHLECLGRCSRCNL